RHTRFSRDWSSDVCSSDLELVGRLAELVTRLQRARETMQGNHTVQEWVQILSDALTDLTDTRGVNAWQLPNALGAIASLAESARSEERRVGKTGRRRWRW